jgi:hypothetical protein
LWHALAGKEASGTSDSRELHGVSSSQENWGCGAEWHCWRKEYRTNDGRAFRLLTIIGKTTRECLAIDVARRLTSEDGFLS